MIGPGRRKTLVPAPEIPGGLGHAPSGHLQNAPAELVDLNIQQIVGFAGKLSDGSPASQQVRDYLAAVPSHLLTRYAEECLTTKFEGNGFALQDVVNTMGRRLGFEVTLGATGERTADPGSMACGRLRTARPWSWRSRPPTPIAWTWR